eukprot:scaffold30115_cov99-Amphora_coffeaeformis.AAC.1
MGNILDGTHVQVGRNNNLAIVRVVVVVVVIVLVQRVVGCGGSSSNYRFQDEQTLSSSPQRDS